MTQQLGGELLTDHSESKRINPTQSKNQTGRFGQRSPTLFGLKRCFADSGESLADFPDFYFGDSILFRQRGPLLQREIHRLENRAELFPLQSGVETKRLHTRGRRPGFIGHRHPS